MRRAAKAGQAPCCVVDADALPQTIGRDRAPGPSRSGIDVVGGRPGRGGRPTAEALRCDAAGGRPVFGVLVQYPGGRRRACATWRPLVDAAHERGRAGHRRRRPARADPAHAARASRAPTSSSAPASASACRWASAARTPASWRCAPGWSARCPAGWSASRVDADGAPGLPAGAADPRAAHPPREGDQQHLHRAGAAGRDGRRCTPSTTARTGCAAIAAARARRTPPRWPRRCAAGGVEVVHERVLRHRRWPGCRAGPPRSSPPRASRGHQLLRQVDADHVSASRCDETTTPERPRRGAGPRSASRRRSTPAPTAAAGRRAGAGRRRCARTSAYLTHPVFHSHRSETAMLRYLRRLADRDFALDRGDDPARLVHDEAQRDHRDGADHLARVRRPAPVRPGRAGRRASAR